MTVSECNGTEYDIAIAAIGYEHRGRHAYSTLSISANLKMACAFDDRHCFSFSDNYAWFLLNGFSVKERNTSDFPAWVDSCLLSAHDLVTAAKKDLPLRVIVDISSFTRYRIACIVLGIAKLAATQIVAVDFVYSVGEFCKPNPVLEGPLKVAPVTSELAGWSSNPLAPVSTIFGLGFEYDIAVGVAEYLEPREVWAFKPVENILQEYGDEILEANNVFWDVVSESHIIPYNLAKPGEVYSILESLVAGTMRSSRPVLVPLGPKIFALLCCLVALRHRPSVAVWRVSPGSGGTPIDRIARGDLICLRLIIEPACNELREIE